MRAIETKYHGATDTKGERFSASCNGCKRVYVGRDYELDESENHAAAAKKLRDGMGWGSKQMVGANSKTGMVWVFKNGSPHIDWEIV